METKKTQKRQRWHPHQTKLRNNIRRVMKKAGLTAQGLYNSLMEHDPKRYPKGNHVSIHRKIGNSLRYGRHSSIEATEAWDIAQVLGVPLDELFRGCGV